MVKWFLILLCWNALIAKAQEKDSIESDLISIIEFPPLFDKSEDILSFIDKNIIYPNTAIADSLEGIVAVSFWIEKDGTTSRHAIVKGVRNDLDEEALRVAKLIKFSKPAYQKGIPMSVKYTIPIKFKVNP